MQHLPIALRFWELYFFGSVGHLSKSPIWSQSSFTASAFFSSSTKVSWPDFFPHHEVWCIILSIGLPSPPILEKANFGKWEKTLQVLGCCIFYLAWKNTSFAHFSGMGLSSSKRKFTIAKMLATTSMSHIDDEKSDFPNANGFISPLKTGGHLASSKFSKTLVIIWGHLSFSSLFSMKQVSELVGHIISGKSFKNSHTFSLCLIPIWPNTLSSSLP